MIEALDKLTHGGIDTVTLLLLGGLLWFIRRELADIRSELKRIKSEPEIIALVESKFVRTAEYRLEVDQMCERIGKLEQRKA